MLLGLIGAAFTATSAIGIVLQNPKVQIRSRFRKYCQATKLEGVRMLRVERNGQVFSAILSLPSGVPYSSFADKHAEGIEQALGAVVTEFTNLKGGLCKIRMGFQDIGETDYVPKTGKNPLAVPLLNLFGEEVWLDFSDETSCHLLVGGATRMGKSVFLRLIVTHILTQTKGKCRVLFINNKITDLNMFRDLPQVQLAETIGEARMYVDDLVELIEERKALLKSKGDVVDAREFRQKYSEPMEPIFVVIDEYGRFAENDDFQEQITFIAETAGYLDVHLIISSQRPDAKDVLKPRIKANILTRFAFSTSDETNSKIILDMPGAEALGRIQGRAILLDGVPEKVQVPYLSSEHAKRLLQPYYAKEHCYEEQGSNDCETAEALPRFVSGPIREDGMS